MILEPRTAEVLCAYADTLIPGNQDWPKPSEAGVLEYLERTVAASPTVRGAVLFALQTADALAGRLRQVRFAALDQSERVTVLSTIEQQHPVQFGAVKELVYESYYTSPPVRISVERRTGFRSRAALDGIGSTVFDEVLLKLADVADRPKRVRDAPR